MHILITNDDGIEAPGLKALTAEFATLPQVKITVVAPHLQRSACSHSLTFHAPLRIYRDWQDGCIHWFSSSGTPTDCLMLGFYQLCETRPDFILSGVNCGANMGYDVSYSATVSAALEGIPTGIPAMAVSLVGRSPKRYGLAASWARRIFEKWSDLELPASSIASVNVPDIEPEAVKGVLFTGQGRSIYRQGVKKLVDPWGGTYYWIYGAIPEGEMIEGTDFKAVADGYVSVTPLDMNLTDQNTLQKWLSKSIAF